MKSLILLLIILLVYCGYAFTQTIYTTSLSLASKSKEHLELALTLSNDEIRTMISEYKVFIMFPGYNVTVIKTDGDLIKVKYVGTTVEVWMLKDAIIQHD